MTDRAPRPPLDVLCFGEAIVDFMPERTGVRLREVARFERHLGGAPANLAVGLARLGLRAGLVTLVGDDEFGAFLIDALAAEGVEVSGVGVHASARTGITFVQVGPHGERSFTFYRHPSADQLITEDDVDVGLVGAAHVVHYGSSTFSHEPARAATLRALEVARAAGRVVSADPNPRPHLWSDPGRVLGLLRGALAMTDVVKVSEDELEIVVGTRDAAAGARALRGLGVELAVVTMGERGCVYDGAACGQGHVPARRVDVLDTTGAGDGFLAGLLAHLAPAFAAGERPATLDRGTVEAACLLGHRVAARVCTRLGATAALPHRHEL